ncbi:guanine nucleotide-binding protein G(f) subunit alpha-like isoform X2 [Bacillus rossius redtenbacheri]|uniref:guanine nucleotide-binding protein G(f) subunit alpha-like isoform X2 n=1 Tax=Bacillus rossius redtenbacheri TaxID=93214 RepID=UPI002FDDA82D
MRCLGRQQSEERKASKELDKKIRLWSQQYNKAIKLLLLGPGESGKTTILKQMKILHIKGFSDSERLAIVSQIRQNVHESIYDIVRNMTQLDPPIDLDDDQSGNSAVYILDLGKQGPQKFDTQYFDHVQILWGDSGVQECYRRSSEFQLISSAKYFLDRIDKVRLPGYNPSDQDILHSRKRTTGIQKIEFTVKVPASYGGGSQTFWMFDVGGQRGERHKWIQVFEGIQAILFLTAASDYDLVLREDRTVNRLRETVELFDNVWNSRFLQEAGYIMFLNKQDVLKEKTESGKRIGDYFPEYHNYKFIKKGIPFDEYTKTKCFIRDLFVEVTRKRRNTQLDNQLRNSGLVVPARTKPRECYYHFTTATDTDNIRKVFDDVHSMIIEMNLQAIGIQ